MSIDLVRSGGCDRTDASKLVHRARRALKATASGLDANPASPAFLVFGFRDDVPEVNGWGAAADLAEVIATRRLHPYFRIVAIDVALAAARLRKRAKEHAIELGQWTDTTSATEPRLGPPTRTWGLIHDGPKAP